MSVVPDDSIPAMSAALDNYLHIMGCIDDTARTARVTVGQLKLVFLKYADNHPEELHLPAAKVLSKALLAAFPCPANKGRTSMISTEEVQL